MDDSERPKIARIVRAALREDLLHGDLTSKAVVPRDLKVKARLEFRAPGVLCGITVAHLVFSAVDKKLLFRYDREDGARVDAGATVALVMGRAQSILAAERTALNFLQRLSGIATLTRRYVDAFKPIDVYDTRKTTPTLRVLEKYAVRTGGGHNHRSDLGTIFVKDNHIAAAGIDAVERAAPEIVEADTAELAERLSKLPSVRRILLDNMSADAMRAVVKRIRAGIVIEASGGVRLDDAPKLKSVGVHAVSVGALTHSAPALDIALEVEKV